jgi:hypothetical protein
VMHAPIVWILLAIIALVLVWALLGMIGDE